MTNNKLEVRIFINGEHKLGHNLYVAGRINGIMSAISKVYSDRIPSGIEILDEGTYMKTYCTMEEFVELVRKINHDYEGLCQFSVTEIEE